jgi:NADH-quinone oxidoreductase subunit M
VVWWYAKNGGGLTFDILTLQKAGFPGSIAAWSFAAFFIAFAIKVPMFPVHTWLPDAHTEAPTAGSVILAGVLLKMGVYGMIRFCVGFFPEMAVRAMIPVLILSVIAIVYGAAMSLIQPDMKRLGGIFLGEPHGVRDRRALRIQSAGHRGVGSTDGQPRRAHGRAFHDGRLLL